MDEKLNKPKKREVKDIEKEAIRQKSNNKDVDYFEFSMNGEVYFVQKK